MSTAVGKHRVRSGALREGRMATTEGPMGRPAGGPEEESKKADHTDHRKEHAFYSKYYRKLKVLSTGVTRIHVCE